MEDKIKYDCFAFKYKRDENGELIYECDALNSLYCEKEKCRFYKKKGTV